MSTQTKYQYGEQEVTKVTDDNGSTETVVSKTHAGVTRAVSRRVKIRHRTDKTDLASLARIAESLLNDPLKLDAELKLERTKYGEEGGYYHIVECYTVLEY